MSTIVKVQRSIMTTGKTEQVLIYNESRTIQYQGDLPDEVKRFMGDKLKIYAEAKIDKAGIVRLQRAVKARSW